MKIFALYNFFQCLVINHSSACFRCFARYYDARWQTFHTNSALHANGYERCLIGRSSVKFGVNTVYEKPDCAIEQLQCGRKSLEGLFGENVAVETTPYYLLDRWSEHLDSVCQSMSYSIGRQIYFLQSVVQLVSNYGSRKSSQGP